MSKKIIILISIISLLVGCTRVDKPNTVHKNSETNKEILKEENKEKETKSKSTSTATKDDNTILNVYKPYGGHMSYAGDYNLNEEDEHFIQSLISKSLFINNDYKTIQDVIESFYGTYNYKINKLKDGVYEVIYTMKFEFDDEIENHEMVIKADFNTSEYKLIKLSINNEVIKTANEIDNYIYSLNDNVSVEEETNIIEEPQQHIVDDTKNIERRIINNFNSGYFYNNKVNISITRMKAVMSLQVSGVNEDGHVIVESLSRTNDLQLVFAKLENHWRIIYAEKDGYSYDTDLVELAILDEILN